MALIEGFHMRNVCLMYVCDVKDKCYLMHRLIVVLLFQFSSPLGD
jgi:hypothetical protein